jgi:hypothetical protein
MVMQRDSTERFSRSLSRRTILASIAAAGSALLAACGGSSGLSATVATVSAPTVAPTIGSSVASPPVTGSGQPAATSPTAPAATVSKTTAPTVASKATAAATVATSATTGAAKGAVDPSLLVTSADYLAVMGHAASDPVKKTAPLSAGITRSSCEYKIATADKVEFVMLTVIQRDANAPARADMQTYWEGTKRAWTSTQEKVTPLPDIGPEVFLVDNPLLDQAGAGNRVQLFKNDVMFAVQAVTGSGMVDDQNTAGAAAGEKLAKIAFGRM